METIPDTINDIKDFIVSWFDYLHREEPVATVALLVVLSVGVLWLFRRALR